MSSVYCHNNLNDLFGLAFAPRNMKQGKGWWELRGMARPLTRHTLSFLNKHKKVYTFYYLYIENFVCKIYRTTTALHTSTYHYSEHSWLCCLYFPTFRVAHFSTSSSTKNSIFLLSSTQYPFCLEVCEKIGHIMIISRKSTQLTWLKPLELVVYLDCTVCRYFYLHYFTFTHNDFSFLGTH